MAPEIPNVPGYGFAESATPPRSNVGRKRAARLSPSEMVNTKLGHDEQTQMRYHHIRESLCSDLTNRASPSDLTVARPNVPNPLSFTSLFDIRGLPVGGVRSDDSIFSSLTATATSGRRKFSSQNSLELFDLDAADSHAFPAALPGEPISSGFTSPAQPPDTRLATKHGIMIASSPPQSFSSKLHIRECLVDNCVSSVSGTRSEVRHRRFATRTCSLFSPKSLQGASLEGRPSILSSSKQAQPLSSRVAGDQSPASDGLYARHPTSGVTPTNDLPEEPGLVNPDADLFEFSRRQATNIPSPVSSSCEGPRQSVFGHERPRKLFQRQELPSSIRTGAISCRTDSPAVGPPEPGNVKGRHSTTKYNCTPASSENHLGNDATCTDHDLPLRMHTFATRPQDLSTLAMPLLELRSGLHLAHDNDEVGEIRELSPNVTAHRKRRRHRHHHGIRDQNRRPSYWDHDILGPIQQQRNHPDDGQR